MHIVYGGAFNPPTKAHLEVYHQIKAVVDVDSFTYLPVSSAYTKSDLASNYHRLNMLKLLTEDHDDIMISDLEMHDSNFLGTYQSLIRLSDHQQEETAFVVGADNLPNMKDWKHAESLLSEFKIIVLNRDNKNLQTIIEKDSILNKHKQNFIIVQNFNQNMSSTEFRKTFDHTLLTDKVYTYIKDNQLYQ